MNPLLAVARTQWRRTARSRVVLVCLILAVVTGSMYVRVLVWGSTDPELAAMRAVWQILGAFSNVGLVLAAMLGAWAVQSESRDRTWQGLLTKPVLPWQIVGGKFLGVMTVFAGLALLLWVAGHGLFALRLHRYLPRLDLAIAFQLLSFAIPLALALCLSLRVNPIAAALIAVLLRHDALEALFSAVASAKFPRQILFFPAMVVGAFKVVAPDYGPFDLTKSLPDASTILWGRLGWIAGYGAAMVCALLSLACFFLRRRDLGRSV